MYFSLFLIIIGGLLFASIASKIHLPKIVGMLVIGVIIGPYVLNLIDDSILGISEEIRKIALIIILFRAGLNLKINDLKKNGKSAILLAFLPASFEIVGVVILAPLLFGISYVEALLLGSVLAAVSPAVVVPAMIKLINKGYGKDKAIPELILAGASIDDIYVIVLFSSFLNLNLSGEFNFLSLLRIPTSILFGILVGVLCAYLLMIFFKRFKLKEIYQAMIIMALALLLVAIEDRLDGIIAMSGLLAIIVMGLAFNNSDKDMTVIRKVYDGLWSLFEILLFVLVGASVNISYALNYVGYGLLLIVGALMIRMIGVYLSIANTSLTLKERLFVMGTYTPKATVQAAIGGLALSAGLEVGELILSLAVLSIIITAPLGASFIECSHRYLLQKGCD